MQSCVVDATVAVKWVLLEENRAPSLSLLEDYREGRLRLVAPHLIVAEIGNVLWKKVQKRELSESQCSRAFSLFLINCPVLIEAEEIWKSALELAVAHNRTFYDSLYVALALGLKCELVTADQKLYNALHRVFPSTLVLTSPSDIRS